MGYVDMLSGGSISMVEGGGGRPLMDIWASTIMSRGTSEHAHSPPPHPSLLNHPSPFA